MPSFVIAEKCDGCKGGDKTAFFAHGGLRLPVYPFAPSLYAGKGH